MGGRPASSAMALDGSVSRTANIYVHTGAAVLLHPGTWYSTTSYYMMACNLYAASMARARREISPERARFASM